MLRSRTAACLAWAGLLLASTAPAAEAPPAAASATPAAPAADGAFAPMSDLIGFGSSGESFGEYPRTFPRLKELGVHWVRMFPEWATVQPRPGEWDWGAADRLVATGREHGIRTLGVLCYFAPWSSSRQGDTRAFPVRDMQFWRDYVTACVARYQDDIDAWEVWNEPNSGAFNKGGSVKDYADLVREAYRAAKAVHPKVRIGITCASFDVNYLDQVMSQGAAGCFDFVAVHPYNSIEFLFSNEASYLGMAATLRKLIEKHRMPASTEMWITEIGLTTRHTAAEDARQAEALAKVFLLSAAQGFRKVFWFEAKGPRYGEGDFSILNADDSVRPSGQAAGTLARTLGARRYAGWLNPEGKSYGFMFDGEGGPVLAAWAPPGADVRVRFPSAVVTVDMTGRETPVPAGQDVALTTMPLLVKDPPADLVQAARSHVGRPMPWGTDYAQEREAWCRLAVANTHHGVVQKEWGDGATTAGLVDGDEYRSTGKSNRSPYMYFDVDNSFAAFGDHDLEITVVARCARGQKAALKLCYESLTGYHETPGSWTVPGDDAWSERTFRVTDANFADTWGWNFRIDVAGSPGDVWVKEVRVRRNAPKQ